MSSYWLICLALMVVLCVRSIGFSAELQTLSTENYPKLVDPSDTPVFMGDYALTNGKLTAIVADTELMTGRSSSRWAINNTSGCIISLKTADMKNGLVGYYPGPLRFKHDAPQTQSDFIDESKAWQEPGRQAGKDKSVRLVLPLYEADSGTKLDEILALPAHRRPPVKPTVEQVYELADETPWLVSATTYHNPSTIKQTVRTSSRINTIGRTHWGTSFDGHMVWVYDANQGYAYAVVDRKNKLRCTPDIDGLTIFIADGKDQETNGTLDLAADQKFVVERLVIAGKDAAQVYFTASQALDRKTEQVAVTVKRHDGAPAQNVLVEIDTNQVSLSAARTDERGVVTLFKPATTATLRAKTPGLTPVETSLETNAKSTGAPALTLPEPALLKMTVMDDNGNPTIARVTITGLDKTPTPNFGPNTGRDRVGNSLISISGLPPISQPASKTGSPTTLTIGQASCELTPGEYEIFVSKGPEFDVWKQKVTLAADKPTELSATLKRAISREGWTSADLHVHTAVTGKTRHYYVSGYKGYPRVDGDSTADPVGKVLALEAAGIDLAAAAEHNFAYDYNLPVKSAGLHDQAALKIKLLPGAALTAGRRHATQHYNLVPVPHLPGRQDGGSQQRPEHIGLLPWANRWDTGQDKLIVAVHPTDSPITVSAQMEAIEIDDFLTIASGWESKVFSDSQTSQWLALLAEGYKLPAVTSSNNFDNSPDSGRLRTYLQNPAGLPTEKWLISAVREGRALLSSGPFIKLELVKAGQPGIAVSTLPISSNDKVKLQVSGQWNNTTTPQNVQLLLNGKPGFTLSLSPSEIAARKFDQTVEIDLKDDTFVQAVFVGHEIASTASTDTAAGKPAGEKSDQRPAVAITNPLYLDLKGDGFIPASPLHDKVTPRMHFVSPVLATKDGFGLLEVTLTNTSDQTSQDTFTLEPMPAANIIVEPASQAYSLAPGEAKSLLFKVRLSPERLAGAYPVRTWSYVTRDLFLKSARSSKGVGRKPASITLEVDQPLTPIPAATDVKTLADALKNVRPLTFVGRPGPSMGQVRLGFAGDYLAVSADVNDKTPTREALTSGSVEIYGAMQGVNKVFSVALVPEADGKPAEAFIEATRQLIPAKGVKVFSEKTNTGYRINAMIPFGLLGVDMDQTKVLFEVRANMTEGKTLTQQSTIGNRAPHLDNRPYPRFRPIYLVQVEVEGSENLSAKEPTKSASLVHQLTNTSDQPVKDQIRLAVPDRAGVTVSPASHEVEIPAKGNVQIKWTLTPDGQGRVGSVPVKVVRSPAGFVGAVPEHLIPISDRPISPTWSRDQPLVSPAGKTIGQIKYRLDADWFELSATMNSPTLNVGKRIWDGDCVELFFADVDGQNIRQFFITPGDKPAVWLNDSDGPMKLDDCQATSTKADVSYTVTAKIPRSKLELGAAGFLLEAQSSIQVPDQKQREYGTLFGSKLAYQDARLFGRMTPTEQK